MHMHVKTKDGTIAGHVDRLEPSPNMRLKLPTLVGEEASSGPS